MPRSKTRARARTLPFDPAWPKVRRAQLLREVNRRLTKLYAVDAWLRKRTLDAAQEKAPGLAAEGFNDVSSRAKTRDHRKRRRLPMSRFAPLYPRHEAGPE